jgi:hypothetical protein
MSIKNLLSSNVKSDQNLNLEGVSISSDTFVVQDYDTSTTVNTTKKGGRVTFTNFPTVATQSSIMITMSNPNITINNVLLLTMYNGAQTDNRRLTISVDSVSNGSATINFRNNSTANTADDFDTSFNYLII